MLNDQAQINLLWGVGIFVVIISFLIVFVVIERSHSLSNFSQIFDAFNSLFKLSP